MHFHKILSSCLLLFSVTASAQWKKINDVDYVWGPFSIYNLALFSETGAYTDGTRPLMLTLKYQKPVDGRDFAISLARSWSNLGITLPQQDEVVDRLRKSIPNIKKGDSLSYIALPDKGYFVLNDTVIAEEFNSDFNNAVVAVWLDPRVEIGRALLSQKQQTVESAKSAVVSSSQTAQTAQTQSNESQASTEQAVTNSPNLPQTPAPEAKPSENPETPPKPEDEPQELLPPSDALPERPLS